ncbi:hypothetical protein PG991_009346 [Apiospora marii]|uniref:Uncharacterized protein n=1 Tax=Apiospora marii TaxID=335849 RepID=A0ABR1RKP1_9PEZI
MGLIVASVFIVVFILASRSQSSLPFFVQMRASILGHVSKARPKMKLRGKLEAMQLETSGFDAM